MAVAALAKITATSNPEEAAAEADLLSESVPEDPELKGKVFAFRRKDIIFAPCAGSFQPAVQLEQRVQEGDCLGVIVPLLDENGVEVLSPRDGIVLHLRRESVVGEQDSLVPII